MRDSCHWGARRRSARSTALSNLWAARCGRRTPQPGQRMTHTPRGTTRQTHTCTCAPTPSQLRRCVLRNSGRQAQALGRAVCVYGVRSSRPPPKCEFAAAPRRGRVSGMRVRWRSSTRNARAACSEPYSETSRRAASVVVRGAARFNVRAPLPRPLAAGSGRVRPARRDDAGPLSAAPLPSHVGQAMHLHDSGRRCARRRRRHSDSPDARARPTSPLP
jgi:hypothetical protein